RVGERGRFELGGVDVLSAGDEHVLEPVDDEEEPVIVEVADVTGVEPAAGGERGSGGRLVVPVGTHDIGSAGHDLAADAGPARVAGGIADIDLGEGHGPTGRSGSDHRLLGGEAGAAGK